MLEHENESRRAVIRHRCRLCFAKRSQAMLEKPAPLSPFAGIKVNLDIIVILPHPTDR